MSEQINKVLASTAQAFTTAEQKQARDNISAQAKITYSYSAGSNFITAIDGSGVGNPLALTTVYHDGNLSGLGTSASLLGLNDPMHFTSQRSAEDPVSSMKLAYSGIRFEVPSAWTAEHSFTNSKIGYEWPSALDTENHRGWYSHSMLDGRSMSISAHDCSYIKCNVITATTVDSPYLGIYGGYGSGYNQTSIVAAVSDQNRPDPYISFNASGSSELVDMSSIRRWNAKQDASGMSAFVPYSAVKADSDSAVTSINGSSVGKFTGVSANYNITGNGTSGSPLGASDPIQLTASDKTASYGSNNAFFTSSGYSTKVLSTAVELNGNNVSSTARASGFRVRADMGGSYAYADYGVQGITYDVPLPGWGDESASFSVGGIRGVGNFGSNMYDDNWLSAHRYQGTGDTGNGMWQDVGYYNGTSVLRYPSITLYTPGDSAVINHSSIAYWNGKLDSLSINYGLSGNGTSGSPLGVTACSGKFEGLHSDYFYALTSRDLVFSSYDKDNSRTEAKTVFNEYGMRMTGYNTAGSASSVITLQDDGYRFEDAVNNTEVKLNSTSLKFTVGAYPNYSSEVVDTASIQRWNSYSAGNWAESGNPLSTGYGGNQVSAASQYNETGNWAARTVKMSGLPDQTLYGFQSRPNGTATYGINQAGAFVAVPQQKYFTYLFHETGAAVHTFDMEIYPTGLTADARLDFVNLCSAASANVKTDSFHGNTANINPGESATMWYIATADIWTDGANPVPV